jgi:hypothetical protein
VLYVVFIILGSRPTNPTKYERDILPTEFTDIFREVPPCFATRCLCCKHRAVVDKLGMIKTQMETRHRSESGRSVWDALYDTTP